MAKKMWAIVLVLVLLATSGLAGCAREAELGTEDHPFQIYFAVRRSVGDRGER